MFVTSRAKGIGSSLVLRGLLVALFFLAPVISGRAQDDPLQTVLQAIHGVEGTLLNLTALTDEEENTIGRHLLEKIGKEKPFISSGKFDTGDIFRRLKGVVSRKAIGYELRILRDDDFNAFAVAGGKTVLLKGMLDGLNTRDEVAFVIAHEIAHNELKHCVKKIQYAARASGIHPLLGDVVQIAYSIYSIPFSQQEEMDADALGVKLMEKAGFDRKGMVRFFNKLEIMEKRFHADERDALNDFISSHPTAKRRLQALESGR